MKWLLLILFPWSLAAQDRVPGELILKLKVRPGLQRLAGKVLQDKLSQKAFLKGEVSGVMHFQAHQAADTDLLIKELRKDPDIEYAEPNYLLWRADIEESDQHIYSLEELRQLALSSYTQSFAAFGVLETWPILKSAASKPIVAIVDTGIDYNHSIFLATNSLWRNAGEIPGNGIDDEGDGFIDDIYGWNFSGGNALPLDDEGHGTHVAGIIQGVGQDIFSTNAEPAKIQLMALKFMDAGGSGSTMNAISSIYFAVDHGAKVINNSWGGNNYSQALHDALTYAYNHGVIIVSAAGNYGRNNDSQPLYPAGLPVPSHIAVAATNDYDQLAYFSSFGAQSVHLGAPGVTIFSTYKGNSFRYLSGTSMAAPMVAGLAALISREAPNLSGYQIKEHILRSADYISTLDGKVKTAGRMDAYAAVVSAKGDVGVLAYQPSYVAVAPAGANNRSGQGLGCGTVQTQQASGVFFFLFLLPAFVWLVLRKRVSRSYGRQHDRFLIDSQVRIQVAGQELIGRMNTIGLGGVSFNAQAMIATGGNVNLTITAPDGSEQLQVLGRIVWNEANQAYGVKFAPLRETLLERIRLWTSNLVKT
jgi:hypothetical protein